MKVVAINSSPNMDKGNTAIILDPFIAGMREAGAEVDLYYTKKLNINPCQGEFNCWFKTPGVCFQKDDMQWLLPKMNEAKIWVLATPLYVDGMTGPMKNLIDRIIPNARPSFELRDGHIRHPGRGQSRASRMVLVSNCGFWEKDNFDALLVHVQAICKNTKMRFKGALLRPHGPALKRMLQIPGLVDNVIEAARDAGRQLIREDEISQETLDIVSRNLIPIEDYLNRGKPSPKQQVSKPEKKP